MIVARTVVDHEKVSVLFEGGIIGNGYVRVTGSLDAVHTHDEENSVWFRPLVVERRGDQDALGNYNWSRVSNTDPAYLTAILLALWRLIREHMRPVASGPDIDGLPPSQVASMFGATLFPTGK